MSVSILLNGLLIGSLYGLVGIGLSLLAGVARLINLAQGDFLIGGAYLAIVFDEQLHWDPLFLIPVVAVVAFAIAYGIQRLFLNRLLKVNPTSSLVVTFGISLILQSSYQGFFGANPRSLPASWGDSGINLLGIRIQTAYLVVFVVGLVLTSLTWCVLQRSRLGSVVRAAASDPATARLLGIDVDRVFAATFACSAVLAAVAGVLTSVAQSVSPTGGFPLLLFSFAVMAVAGIGNVPGAFVAGMVIGLLQSVSVYVFGAGTQQLVVYVMFFLILIARPSGLLSRRPVLA